RTAILRLRTTSVETLITNKSNSTCRTFFDVGCRRRRVLSPELLTAAMCDFPAMLTTSRRTQRGELARRDLLVVLYHVPANTDQKGPSDPARPSMLILTIAPNASD